jgi:hypothetical protein
MVRAGRGVAALADRGAGRSDLIVRPALGLSRAGMASFW